MAYDKSVFTVGHSSHALDGFLALLRQHQIDVVVDVRSQPYSRYAPQFDREELAASLQRVGVRYEFCGPSLGGRPTGQEFYDGEGHVLYGRMAETPSFLAGLDHVLDPQIGLRPVLMCAEEDPTHCHRRLLVARALEGRGVLTLHIRGDGRLESDADVDARANRQPALFPEEGLQWRSTRSVTPRRPQKDSSAY